MQVRHSKTLGISLYSQSQPDTGYPGTSATPFCFSQQCFLAKYVLHMLNKQLLFEAP